MRWNPERVLVYRKSPELAAVRTAQAPTVSRRQRVGIWDLNASAGSLPHVLDLIEERQTYFSFYCVEAAFQMGLTLPGAHVAREWKARTGDSMTRADASVNVSARPIFAAAQPVLAGLPIDWLVVVVKSMISDTSDLEDPWHNLFASTQGQVVLISTYGLREYAAEAGRPFESAVVGTVLSMLVQQLVPEIEPQDLQSGVSTGSIFDFCENKSEIVKVLRAPTIDPVNRAKIPEEILEPTEKIIHLLTQYKGSTTRAQFQRQLQVSAQPKTESKARKAAVAASPESQVPFKALLKALDASLPKSTRKKRASAKKQAVKKAGKERATKRARTRAARNRTK